MRKLTICQPFTIWIQPLPIIRKQILCVVPWYVRIYTDNYWNYSREYGDGTLYYAGNMYTLSVTEQPTNR